MHPTHPCARAVDITPADILRGAARYLEVHGWTQGLYYRPTGNPFPAACATGAIAMAVYGYQSDDPYQPADRHGLREFTRALDALVDVINRTDPPFVNAELDGWDTATSPFCWNDAHGQTAAHVIATLRQAADDYDWTHATADDLETYAEHELDNDRIPTREGFLAWRAAR